MGRKYWVDVAKAFGIAIVFYIHFAERLYNSGSTVAFEQFKFLISFVMQFFFFISGFFAKVPGSLTLNTKALITKRLLPVLVFSILILPAWLFKAFYFKSVTLSELFSKSLDYLHGTPSFNIVTWFLVCLFTTELIASFILKRYKEISNLIIIAFLALLGGLFICNHLKFFENSLGIARNTWYIHESIVALGFYLLGYILYPYLQEFKNSSHWYKNYLIITVSLMVLLITYNLNYTQVVMLISLHGKTLPFLISSFAGISLLVSIAFVMPELGIIRFIGENTLIYLGLNGFFHHFFNKYLVDLLQPVNTWWAISITCLVVTISSLLVCYPLVVWIKKWLPKISYRISNKEYTFQRNYNLVK